MAEPLLYQFTLSHYCEKVRFAMDYKGVPYRTRDLLPGVHRLVTSRIGQGSSVPILSHEGRGIQGSEAILNYLDERWPGLPLTPSERTQREQVLGWEAVLDEELGTSVRRYCYHHLLAAPDILVPFFTGRRRWWKIVYLRLAMPGLERRMREHMGINADSAAAARDSIEQWLDRLSGHYREQPFLVGDVFTRADLTAAALLSPLFMPPHYDFRWPDRPPGELAEAVVTLAPRLAWARRLYRRYRSPVHAPRDF